eukprot:5717567-Prymnesium_polylepis.1
MAASSRMSSMVKLLILQLRQEPLERHRVARGAATSKIRRGTPERCHRSCTLRIDEPRGTTTKDPTHNATQADGPTPNSRRR